MLVKLFAKVFLVFCLSFFAEKAFADDGAQGSGGGSGNTQETTEQKLAAALKRQEELESELAQEKKKKDKKEGGGDDPDDILQKVRREKEDKDNKARETKDVERSIRFNLTIDDFVKSNKDFLPDEVAGILSQASKERYDNEFEKASALKSAILSSYFSVQANVDSLTPAHRKSIEDWKGLTKGDREKRSADIYENVFEPCIETFRRVKKAEEVQRSRSGLAKESVSGEAYKQKLMRVSQRAHLGIKD